ncbi:MAG: hypothetical protein QOI24_2761 [Acidobacteriota bacterium]|nr:hypothetical protein [Acidobacteriota bacterium]
MFKPAADTWALEVAQQVVDREAFETTHVELKSELPDVKKFARQFAGLANAAQWHPVLLLVGLDSKRGVVGVPSFEVGDWYMSLRALFEYGEAPALVYQNFLTFTGKQLAAFVFETDNPPYVVAESKQGGAREVPWRYGANTGVAGRRELLSLLLRRVAAPEIEFASAQVRRSSDGVVRVDVELFVYPAASADELAIPVHRVTVQVVDSAGAVQDFPDEVTLRPTDGSSRATYTDSIVAVPAPSKLRLTARCDTASRIAQDSPMCDVSFTIHPARATTPIRFTVAVARREHPDLEGYWELPRHHSVPLRTKADVLREAEDAARRTAPRINWNPLGRLPGPL